MQNARYLERGPLGWKHSNRNAIRGITIGPIENALHAGVGYGSEAFGRSLDECVRAGATWVALTPFGRVADLQGRGIDRTFEQPFELNRAQIERAIDMAHARGLSVMLVPHLWVESGEWRAMIKPPTDRAWNNWMRSYSDFVLTWAKVAESKHVELLSAGVELRSWVTTSRASAFASLIRQLRETFHGLMTYSANWDDVDNTIILGELDVIGINAFYPLASDDGAPFETLRKGAEKVASNVRKLSEQWQKPVLFTEIGYTTRPNPAVRPWEWPDAMTGVSVDEVAQADAYRALIAPLIDEPSFAGFFVWRIYADPNDTSQEAEWGFSPRGKLAELVVRDAFAASWAGDSRRTPGWARAAQTPGLYP